MCTNIVNVILSVRALFTGDFAKLTIHENLVLMNKLLCIEDLSKKGSTKILSRE